MAAYHPTIVPEATLEETDGGLVPASVGWFVLNARDARWFDKPGQGHRLPLTGDDEDEAQICPARPSSSVRGFVCVLGTRELPPTPRPPPPRPHRRHVIVSIMARPSIVTAVRRGHQMVDRNLSRAWPLREVADVGMVWSPSQKRDQPC